MEVRRDAPGRTSCSASMVSTNGMNFQTISIQSSLNPNGATRRMLLPLGTAWFLSPHGRSESTCRWQTYSVRETPLSQIFAPTHTHNISSPTDTLMLATLPRWPGHNSWHQICQRHDRFRRGDGCRQVPGNGCPPITQPPYALARAPAAYKKGNRDRRLSPDPIFVSYILLRYNAILFLHLRRRPLPFPRDRPRRSVASTLLSRYRET